MIERIAGLPEGVIGMRAVGVFTVDDYAAHIEPELARVGTSGARLRLLLHLGPQFSGFGEGAWGDLTKELRATRFHRGAVVTDDPKVRVGVAVLRFRLRGQVRTFPNAQFDRAVSWVAS